MNKHASEDQLRRWVAEGKNSPAIAALLGRTDQSVRAALSVLGISTRKHGQRCSLDVAVVAQMLREGKSVQEVALRLGASIGAVRSAAVAALSRNT